MSMAHGQCDARPTVTFPAARHHRPLAGTKLYCLVTEAHVCLTTCPGLYSRAGRPGFELATCLMQVQRPNHSTEANNISVGLTGRDDLSKLVRMNSVWGPNMLTGRIMHVNITVTDYTNSSQSAGQT